jgi:hypothetical protein
MATTPQPPGSPPPGSPPPRPPQWSPQPWYPPPTQRWGPGRVIALICGVLFLLPALGLLLGGGVLLWADGPGRNDDGYLVSGSETFSTPGYAIVSERIDLTTGADWVPLSETLGAVRVEVTGQNPDAAVFVGIAPVADAAAYLADVEYTLIRDFGADTPGSSQTLVPGGAPTGPPGDQDFWTSQSSGPGTRQLTWSPAEGDWLLVIMNADASPGVTVDVRLGATFPALTGLAWGLLIGGLFCLLVGVLLIVLAIRRRPSGVTGPPPPGAYAPPPAWSPSPEREPGVRGSTSSPEGTAPPGSPGAPGSNDVTRGS